VRDASPWLVQRFVYPHAHVELNFFRVRAFDGEPVGHDGQAFAWQDPQRIDVAPLLPANTRVLAALRLPTTYGITCAEDDGEERFLARMERALARGLRLVQLREKAFERARLRAFGARVVALAARRGARVLVNGDDDDARVLCAAGVHWTSARLEQAKGLQTDLLVAASCHTHADVMRACALDLDFVVLGPVLPTPTHPGARALGWQGFAHAIEGTGVPVFALGGLAPGDLDVAIAHGAHGIAMRRHAWPE
jgi:8-oxo-dGTP diphosphatase